MQRLVPAPIPDLELTGEQMLGVRIFDTTVITWDVARAIGVNHGITDHQADVAYSVAQQVIPIASASTDRQRFQPSKISADHTPVERLIAYTGRDPYWQV